MAARDGGERVKIVGMFTIEYSDSGDIGAVLSYLSKQGWSLVSTGPATKQEAVEGSIVRYSIDWAVHPCKDGEIRSQDDFKAAVEDAAKALYISPKNRS
jgi:hypothetical protein